MSIKFFYNGVKSSDYLNKLEKAEYKYLKDQNAILVVNSSGKGFSSEIHKLFVVSKNNEIEGQETVKAENFMIYRENPYFEEVGNAQIFKLKKAVKKLEKNLNANPSSNPEGTDEVIKDFYKRIELIEQSINTHTIPEPKQKKEPQKDTGDSLVLVLPDEDDWDDPDAEWEDPESEEVDDEIVETDEVAEEVVEEETFAPFDDSDYLHFINLQTSLPAKINILTWEAEYLEKADSEDNILKTKSYDGFPQALFDITKKGFEASIYPIDKIYNFCKNIETEADADDFIKKTKIRPFPELTRQICFLCFKAGQDNDPDKLHALCYLSDLLSKQQ